jgi:hypothetical protein
MFLSETALHIKYDVYIGVGELGGTLKFVWQI